MARIGLLYSLADDNARAFRHCDAVFVREATVDGESAERWGRARVIIIGTDDSIAHHGVVFVTGSTGDKLARGMLAKTAPLVIAVAKSQPKKESPVTAALDRIAKSAEAQMVVVNKSFAATIYDTQDRKFMEPGKVVTRQIPYVSMSKTPKRERKVPSVPSANPKPARKRNVPSAPRKTSL